MPLPILLVLVVGGIAGIAMALHMLGLSRALVLDASRARAAWLNHYPDDTFYSADAGEILITHSGDRAIVLSDQGPGIVWVMGADTVARRLDGASWSETRCGAICRLPDPGAPRVAVTLSEPGERDQWLAYLRKYHGL